MVRLRQDIRWEVLGDDVVGLDAGAGVVHRLSDHSAVVARHLLTGESHPYNEEEYDFIVANLLEEHVVETEDAALLSRRSLFRMGAGAAIGISLLALPTAAMAASEIGGGTIGGTSYPAVGAQPGDNFVTTNFA